MVMSSMRGVSEVKSCDSLVFGNTGFERVVLANGLLSRI